MPEFSASTAADFATGEQQGTRVRADEQVELASRNLLSNPDLRDFQQGLDDEPDGVLLDAPEAPSGWGLAIQALGDPDSRMTIQTAGPLPIARDFYQQTGPLIEGPEPKDATRRARIAPPVSPRLEVLAQAYKGYRAGVVGVAYGWIVGKRWNRSPLITEPGPRSFITLASGQGADVPLPDTAPEGITGIYIAMTAPQANANLAATAPLWIQRRLNTGRGLRQTYALYGPFRRQELAPANNQTFIGAAGLFPPPRRHFLKSRLELKPDIFTALSYSILTEFGWSLPQGSTGGIRTPSYSVTEVQSKNGQWFPASSLGGGIPAGAKTRVVNHGWFSTLAWFPVGIPREVKTWRPEFLGPDGAWYALTPRSVRKPAEIHSNDPADFPQGQQPQQVERGRQNQDGDLTGILAPDTALADAIPKLAPDLPPGNYAVRAFWFDEDGRMTRPSPPEVQTVALGQTLRVNRPQSGNAIPNSGGEVIDPTTGLADGWDLASTANFSATLDGRRVQVLDGSGSVADEDAAITPLSPIPSLVLSGDRLGHIRVILACDRYVSGAFRVDMIFTNRAAGVRDLVTLPATKRNSVGRSVVAASVGIAGSTDANGNPPDIMIPANRGWGRLLIRQLGTSVADGARDLDYTAFSFGFFEGLTAPRAYPERLYPKPSIESPDDLYPPAGTCVIRENPPDSERHADLAGITLNSIEYFGPYGTLPANDYGMTGYRTPVKPGQLYTLSCYTGYKGVSKATGYFETVVTDRSGRVLATNLALVPNASGTTPQTRYSMAFTPPADAAYLEISRGLASDGFVSAMAFQLDEGPMTAYTNANTLSGYRRLRFDTGLAGVPDGSKLDDIAEISEWLGAGATYTNDTATSVTVLFRSTADDPDVVVSPAWSAWTEDFGAVPRNRYWEIEVDLATTDPLQSPLVAWAGIRVVRKNPMLMRSDGSEYDYGVQVVDMPPLTPLRINQELTADNNERSYHTRGVYNRQVTFDLECYSYDTAFALVADAQRGDGTHVVEDPQLSMSYRVHIDPESVSWAVDRMAYWTIDEPYHWVIKASGVKATVLQMERIR